MTLEFNWEVDLTDSSFVLAECNEQVYRWLQNTHRWPTNHAMIIGPRFSGKTHLSHIWANRYNAQFIANNYDPINPDACHVVDSLENLTDENYIMRIFYQVDEPVLWVARDEYRLDNNISLKDLKTRLAAIVKIKITNPDEDTFKKILKKRCKDFGIYMSSEILEYVVRRIDITYAALEDFVCELHNECLVQQKLPSIMLIHGIFEQPKYKIRLDE